MSRADRPPRRCSTDPRPRSAGWSATGCPSPAMRPSTDLPREEHRARVTEWTEELAMSGGTAMGYPAEFGGLGDVRGSIAGFETLAFGDLSLLVKCGVQFGLFGGAVLHLGTMRHHERHLTAIARFELPGCFAMSESDHGSNVQALQTTATYDAATEEFVVHTPTPGARKDYIGNAARDGRLAVVFAQLDQRRRAARRPRPPRPAARRRRRAPAGRGDRGLRAEARPRRRRQRPDRLRPGPRPDATRCSTATRPSSADGTYASPIENPAKRFFVMLGTLIQGRVSVCGASITAQQVRARHRDPRTRWSGASSARPAARRRCCSTTARTSAGSSRRSRRRTGCTSRRRGSSTGCTRRSASRSPSAAGASSRRSRPGSRRSPRRTRRRRSRRAARRAAARATCRRAGSRR